MVSPMWATTVPIVVADPQLPLAEPATMTHFTYKGARFGSHVMRGLYEAVLVHWWALLSAVSLFAI